MSSYQNIIYIWSCSYEYDAIENLHKKSCDQSGTSTYYMDPFGPNGQDVIKQVNSL